MKQLSIALCLVSACSSSPHVTSPDASIPVDAPPDVPPPQIATCAIASYPATPVCGAARETWQRPTPSGQALNGVAVLERDDVWAAGGGGEVLHYDGASWTVEQTPVCENLNAIAGTSADDLWAVGDAGRIVHRTAAGWAVVESGSCDSLRSVWRGSGEVWIGGYGLLLHGGTSGFAPAGGSATSLWGFGADDVWAVNDATLWHAGTSITAPWENPSIWGSDADHLVVAGYDRAHDALAVWTFGAATATAPTEEILSTGLAIPVVRGITADDIWLTDGTGLWHHDGIRWTAAAPLPGVQLLQGLAFAGTDDGWAVGAFGERLHWSHQAWSAPSHTAMLTAIWAAAADDAWAVGWDLVLHGDGQRWAPVTGNPGFFESVWGASAHDVYAAGIGTLAHFDGTQWSHPTVPVSGSWHTVSGSGAADVWAAGDAGQVMHFDGTSWMLMPKPGSAAIRSIIAFGAADAWAATDTGLAHWTGAAWADAGPAGAGKLASVWGTSAHDLWVVGSAAWHFDGAAWTRAIAAPQFDQFTRVWGSATNDVWVTPYLNTYLLHWTGSAWITYVNPLGLFAIGATGAGGATWVADGGAIARLVP